jgi:hypothetical protein
MAAERDRRKAPGNRIRLTGHLVRSKPVSWENLTEPLLGAQWGHILAEH